MTIARDLLRLKLAESLAAEPPALTLRDMRLPGIPGKAFAVIGVRRGGKTSFLAQCRADRLAEGRPREAQLLVSLEDERLAGLSVADLGWLIEEHTRQFPGLREAGGMRLTSCARLADRVREDAEFMQVAELYRGRADFDVTRLVVELVEGEAVPFLPVLRYAQSGLQKCAVWERTWDLQRREDAGESVGEIPVPPKYASRDFKKGTYWRLRGKLDGSREPCQTVARVRARRGDRT